MKTADEIPGKIISDFLDWAKATAPELWSADPVRGGTRPEILAAILIASALVRPEPDLENDAVIKLLALQNKENLWDEEPYGSEDEKIGVSGAVTSAWAIIALTARYPKYPSGELLTGIVSGADALYQSEDNGHVKKGGINRGSVLNTNLLVALALSSAAEILPPRSRRSELYRESCRRIIRKVLGYQSYHGAFPYHFDTHRVPVLYQAMVSSLLQTINLKLKNATVGRALGRAQVYLSDFFTADGSIDWDKANLHDKRGAVWAYSFALPVVEEELQARILGHLSRMRKGNLLLTGDTPLAVPDPFYTAWCVFGLSWKLTSPKTTPQLGRTAADYLLLLEYYIRRAWFMCKFATRQLDQKLFQLGSAVENRRWRA